MKPFLLIKSILLFMEVLHQGTELYGHRKASKENHMDALHWPNKFINKILKNLLMKKKISMEVFS